MTTVEKVLVLLASHCLRAHFVDKALLYAKCGYQLFPDRTELLELYGLALLFKGDYDTLTDLISRASAPSRNLDYLKARLAILQGDANSANLVRSYLANRRAG
ncbi:hypothetical protein [uncultured Roseibium sp.]|uniref:hypothetical protein n=1 Tax=uncultured Roseibium sp. TaxID=1936171 RepID=UPI002626E51A|nr:hypothetical protein [uncultured Roseibium sp.]